MKTEKLFIIAFLVFVLVLILFWKIKKIAYRKGYKEGYKQAELDVTSSLLENSIWFGGMPLIHNTLYLFAQKYRKYGNVIASKFRWDLLEIDNTNRVTDLPKEELENVI